MAEDSGCGGRGTRERKRERSQLWVHSPNGSSNKGWARPKPVA